jgi:hypothetical protein
MVKPTAILALLALATGCSTNAPAPAPAPAAKPVMEAPKATVPAPAPAPAAAAIDKTPIKADLTKIKFSGAGDDLYGWDDGESRAFYYTNGVGEVTLKVPADGDYEVVVTAGCQEANKTLAKFVVTVGGKDAGAEVVCKSEDAKDYAVCVPLKAGEAKIGVKFLNDLYKEGEYDLNFYLHGLKLVRVK